ncbi:MULTISPECIES: helix-turn-helix domain-containing protein [Niastella]|uniref:Helix-turn-helix transcriptional regulator n=1 Tax=Niastella soli TaxID=2821487 RepID=A0ABS3Z362_9BACT|nr:AraC family transcriptional regulator [Niastella soli]MBO9204599.1 helix-turn-helix transcriptional regulator [Niastella soli]
MPKTRYSYIRKDIRDAVRRVKKIIDDNPTNGITNEMLANETGISRNVLQNAFKQTHGAPIGQYRLRLRMAYAKQLLGTGRSIKAIAITLHYSSISAFCNAFKKYYGQSPTEWRYNQK